MNYTLQKLNCKPLIGAILSIVVALSLSTRAYAAYSMRLIPNFLFDNKSVYIAENISPRSSTLSSVTISYDSLADLVYYCNEHGLSTTLAYNTALSVYVGFVSDDALDIRKFRVASLHGLLGNVDGKVYVAERKDSGGGTVNNTYNYNQTIINPPSVAPTTRPRPGGTVSSVVTDRELQERIYHSVDSLYQYMSLIIDWLRFVDQDIVRIYKQLDGNVVPALEAINNNIISFKNSAVSSLRAAYSVLSDSYDVQFNLLGVARSLYSCVSGISSRLDSVISNGVVQVNTTSLETRLDKLISMYSKVNSVVLDTAAVNGGQIKDAVGGELKDVMFWGDTANVDNTFASSDGVAYSLNDVKTTVNGLTLRSVNLGSTIPSYIANDPVLYAGVWRKGTDYIISDTYNASTGEYVQRVKSRTFDGSENWWSAQFSSDSRFNLFFLEYSSADNWYFIAENSTHFNHLPVMEFDNDIACLFSNYAAGISDSSITSRYMSEVPYILNGNGFWRVLSYQKYTLDSWKALLSDMSSAGSPFTVLYVPYSAVHSSTIQYFDPSTIAIPEGNSYIFSSNVRITGKYETYDSYTQTADIITAINNIPPYDDAAVVGAITKLENALSKPSATVTADLTEVTTRLDLILAELQSTSGSASCEHTYTQHMEQDADCILPGLMISTCSQCGDSYSEIVDPLGHDWAISSHVDAVTDPDTGEETASAYDVYICSRCGRTYEDHTGNGAPDEDYSNTSISQLVVQVFSKLGTFAGKLIGFFVHLLDKALTSVDNVISKFNDYTAQISSFGGSYPAWLTGFWGIIPSELQAALTFSVICMALGAVGKKLLFS